MIAVVGMACRYPDARSPEELWQNALAQRRAFRRLPPERLRLEDYQSDDRRVPDVTYIREAGLIEGYEFDRVRFKVSGGSFRAADLSHWLALDVADQALAAAGFAEGEGLPRDRTGVMLGNTLAGEFSRAQVMRLRWPYVRRALAAGLAEEGVGAAQSQQLLARLERHYKAPFEPVGEETLAGGMSNTIAGRICNHFDLHGGGYAIDGACSSSLLSTIQGCTALAGGELDVALTGGVDLSLDPFELVGFAKAGALTEGAMRVYDAHSAGFLPGEGCGFLVLMRLEDALRDERPIRAVIRGWGLSSDGRGGITRPELAGQLLALRRAYRRAGCGADTVGYFEGHGTGTAVGDATELKALSQTRREAGGRGPLAAVGSIKANIGHTKAAAGVAGTIKAVMTLETGVLPPHTACDSPHPELCGPEAMLRLLERPESWPRRRPRRAAVSAMGFGGINTHLVLEAAPEPTRSRARVPRLVSSQDAELFLLAAADGVELLHRVERLLARAPGLAYAELVDLAATLAADLRRRPVRAAVVASSPAELTERLERLRAWLADGVEERMAPGVALGTGKVGDRPRIGFAFPGQGSPVRLDGGAWRHRFPAAAKLYRNPSWSMEASTTSTEVAQPAIVTASLAALAVLARWGIAGEVAVGHSLGELTALCWAGAIDAPRALEIATERGRAMAELGRPTGTMLTLAATPDEVGDLLGKTPEAAIACYNAPRQTVISGEALALAQIASRARARGIRVTELAVSHAFHSPLVAAAAEPLEKLLAGLELRPPARPVASTVRGGLLPADVDLRQLLVRQVTAPVRFTEAIECVAAEVDLWLEVGPGEVLSGLLRAAGQTRVFPLLAGERGFAPLLEAVGAAFVLGAPIRSRQLFSGRFTRPFDLERDPCFFQSPCELVPMVDDLPPAMAAASAVAEAPAVPAVAEEKPAEDAPGDRSAIDVVRRLVARRTELPMTAVTGEQRMLGDLHLSSLAVSQLVAEAAQSLGLEPPAAPTEYANASLAQVAAALEELQHGHGEGPHRESADRQPAGVDFWVRPFIVEQVERPSPDRSPLSLSGDGTWRVLGAPDHPWRAPLAEALAAQHGGGGVALCLPEVDGAAAERCVDLMLEAARTVVAERPARFLLVHHGGGGAFARTLHLETGVVTSVVEVPVDQPPAVDRVIREAWTTAPYVEVSFDRQGTRRQPVLRLLEPAEPGELGLGPEDVVLVSGGGKGIAAECALAIARETGARLALLGRSRTRDSAELAQNLERLRVAGITARYRAADVADGAAVRAAVAELEGELGPVTAVLHGAGINRPKPLASLTKSEFMATLEPKLDGLRNLLAAVDVERLQLLLTFGSVIARAGMRGEADYAVANAWLAREVARFQEAHPDCYCLNLEWSVWSGVGMGERLGRVDALLREGITPITSEMGVEMLLALLRRRLDATSIVVAGRLGEVPTLPMEGPELPFLRFLERPRVYVPGIELVADAELSVDTDPYVEDHVFEGDRLFPAVLGLEAMAQAAFALTGAPPAQIEEVRFARPIVVPQDGQIALRVAALVRAPGVVEVVLRCRATAFQADHFRATFRCMAAGEEPSEAVPALLASVPPARRLGLVPERDLYGGLLFQNGRFRRLSGYRSLRARSCLAEIDGDSGSLWFGRYLPAQLMLGDPGARDAALHAIQACIPQATVLPVAVARLLPGRNGSGSGRRATARERSSRNGLLVYDLDLHDEEGILCERWQGLELRIVGPRSAPATWPAPLLAPYLERRLADLVPGMEIDVDLELDAKSERRARGDRLVERLYGAGAALRRRPDGKPELIDGQGFSLSHAEPLTLAVGSKGSIGCDLEPVAERAVGVWHDLLGAERWRLAELVSSELGEDATRAATRVWAAGECLKKAGAPPAAPLVLDRATEDGWVILQSGARYIPTWITRIDELPEPLALAVLVEGS